MIKKFWQGKKALVTGGAGFIGSHFVEELSNKGSFVKCFYLKKNKILDRLKKLQNSNLIEFIQADLLDYKKLKQLCTNIDLVINCAALDGNSEFKKKYSALILDTNIKIVLNILNCAKENNIKNVVLMSSAEIYPKSAKSPISEEDDYRKNFDRIDNGYVLSKRFTELIGLTYAKQFGINVFIPRPTNAYGPGDKFDKKSNRVIPSMIKKILNNKDIEIWGDGSQVRGFIYVKDLVHTILKMVEFKNYRILNIATTESMSILELAKLISKLSGKKERIKLKNTKSPGIKKRILDASKLCFFIDFQTIPLKKGLKTTLDWYLNNK